MTDYAITIGYKAFDVYTPDLFGKAITNHNINREEFFYQIKDRIGYELMSVNNSFHSLRMRHINSCLITLELVNG